MLVTETKTCRDCGKTGLPNAEDWVPSKKYADGWNSRCRACLFIARREQRQAKAESLTDAEFEAKRQKRLEYKRAYNRKNHERLNAKRVAAKLRSRLPKLIAELRALTDARNARDAGRAWKQWAKEQDVAAKRRYGIAPDESPFNHSEASRSYRNDVIVQWVSGIHWTLGSPRYLYGTQVDQRHAELEAQLSAFSSAEIDAALVRDKHTRELSYAFPPSLMRALHRYAEVLAAALTPEAVARARGILLAAELDLEPDQVVADRRAERSAEADGKVPLVILGSGMGGARRGWGGLTDELASRANERRLTQEQRERRNRRRRELRAQRRAEAAASASAED